MNVCLCCFGPTEYYGHGWMGTSGSGSCSKEVCVLCLEGGCKCCGRKLKEPAAEEHWNCEHDKAKTEALMDEIVDKHLVRFKRAWEALAD